MNKHFRAFSRDTLKTTDIQTIKRDITRGNFLVWLKNNYDAIRCYHSTRTPDVGSYYKNGLVPTNMAKATTYFRQLLEDIRFKVDYDIQHIVDLFSGGSDKFIYFCLDKEGFLDHSPHYLIYGSELILAFAQNVSPLIKYELKKIGIPTIFHCDIPLTKFDDEELITLYDRVCSARGRYKEKVGDIFSNYGIIVEGHVSGECIVHHEHPTEILPDFHCGGYYKNDVATCEYCSK